MVKIVLIAIIAIGIYLRFDVFLKQHPHVDEFFQLQSLQNKKLSAVLDNKQFYGDHTSFPGEFLLHYIPMKVLGIFESPIEANLSTGVVNNYSKTRKWGLALPHIIISLFGILAFYVLCKVYLNWQGILIAFLIFIFNSGVIFFDFEFRPYGILQELSIFNLLYSFWFLANYDKNKIGLIGYYILFFFTSIYHAYGILISFLPLIFNSILLGKTRNLLKFPIIILFVQSLIGWAYYASYNSFGIHPNQVQTICNSFQYMPQNRFFANLAIQLFGNDLLLATLLPLVFLGSLSASRFQWIFFLILLVVPLTLIILVDIKTQYWIHQRQYIWLVPNFAIMCGLFIQNLIGDKK